MYEDRELFISLQNDLISFFKVAETFAGENVKNGQIFQLEEGGAAATQLSNFPCIVIKMTFGENDNENERREERTVHFNIGLFLEARDSEAREAGKKIGEFVDHKINQFLSQVITYAEASKFFIPSFKGLNSYVKRFSKGEYKTDQSDLIISALVNFTVEYNIEKVIQTHDPMEEIRMKTENDNSEIIIEGEE